MKVIAISLSILFICIANIYSQRNSASNNNLTFCMDPARIGTSFIELPLSEVNGSPYMCDTFKNGYIQTKSDSLIHLLLRYNIYNDAIEFKIEEQIYTLKNNNEIEIVVIDDHTFKYLEFIKTNGSRIKGYLELLTKGTNQLYCKHRSRYYSKVPEQAYTPAKAPEFKPQSLTYFYSIGNNYPVQFKNKNSLLKLMNNHTKEKTNKISKTKEIRFWNKADVTSLFLAINN